MVIQKLWERFAKKSDPPPDPFLENLERDLVAPLCAQRLGLELSEFHALRQRLERRTRGQGDSVGRCEILPDPDGVRIRIFPGFEGGGE